MSTQPEARRLAAWLKEGAWHQMKLGDVEAAGRELCRQHDALEHKDALLAQSLGYLAHLWDRGPADEGWQSDELMALVEAIRKEIGQ